MSETNTPDPGKTPASTETFSPEYVRELRGENERWRQKAQAEQTAREAAEKKAKDAETAAEARVTEAKTAAETAAQQRVAESDQRANARIVNAELRLAATKAGMIDLDGLKLLDVTKVTLKEDGTVAGADELITQAKKDKPYLFGTGSTSSTATPPGKTPGAGGKDAMQLTDQEWAAERKRLRRGGTV